MKQYILQYVATATLEQMQNSQGTITEKEDKELRGTLGIPIEEDKARRDFAVNSVSRISRAILLAVKSKENPTRRQRRQI